MGSLWGSTSRYLALFTVIWAFGAISGPKELKIGAVIYRYLALWVASGAVLAVI